MDSTSTQYATGQRLLKRMGQWGPESLPPQEEVSPAGHAPLRDSKSRNRRDLTDNSQFRTHVSWAVALRGTTVLLMFLTQIALARNLGIAGYGAFSFAISVVSTLAIVATCGFDTAALRIAATYHQEQQWSLLRGFFRLGVKYCLVVGLVLFGAVLLLTMPFLGGWNESNRLQCLTLAALSIPALGLVRLLDASLRSLGHTVAGLTSRLTIPAVQLLCLLVGVSYFPQFVNSSSAIVIYLLAVSLSLVIAAVLLVNVQRKIPGHGWSEAEAANWKYTALPLMLIAAQAFFHSESGVLLCGFFLSDSEVGKFSVLLRVVAILLFGLQTINLIAAPRIAALYASGKLRELQQLASSCSLCSTLFTVFAAVIVVVCSRFLLGLFGEQFAEADSALAIMVAATVANSMAGSVGYLLMMTGNHTSYIVIQLMGTCLNVCLSLLLIPWFGVLGAALTYFCTTVFWNALLVFTVHRKLGVWSFVSLPLARFGRLT